MKQLKFILLVSYSFALISPLISSSEDTSSGSFSPFSSTSSRDEIETQDPYSHNAAILADVLFISGKTRQRILLQELVAKAKLPKISLLHTYLSFFYNTRYLYGDRVYKAIQKRRHDPDLIVEDLDNIHGCIKIGPHDNVNIKDASGGTVLHHIAHLEMNNLITLQDSWIESLALYLINVWGIDPTIVNYRGELALDIAQSSQIEKSSSGLFSCCASHEYSKACELYNRQQEYLEGLASTTSESDSATSYRTPVPSES